MCAECPLASLCGGGCRAENLLVTGSPDSPVCGPWRVRVLSELLAEDRVDALTWPAAHLMSEARRRGIEMTDRTGFQMDRTSAGAQRRDERGR
jgi:hypothetical protein